MRCKFKSAWCLDDRLCAAQPQLLKAASALMLASACLFETYMTDRQSE